MHHFITIWKISSEEVRKSCRFLSSFPVRALSYQSCCGVCRCSDTTTHTASPADAPHSPQSWTQLFWAIPWVCRGPRPAEGSSGSGSPGPCPRRSTAAAAPESWWHGSHASLLEGNTGSNQEGVGGLINWSPLLAEQAIANANTMCNWCWHAHLTCKLGFYSNVGSQALSRGMVSYCRP